MYRYSNLYSRKQNPNQSTRRRFSDLGQTTSITQPITCHAFKPSNCHTLSQKSFSPRTPSPPAFHDTTTKMGHKVSVIHGVRSEDYYKPGNAINEIWIGHLELISRLPFGDSDMGQAGWPHGGFPKIPWHNFIIPLKRRGLVEGDGDDGYTERLEGGDQSGDRSSSSGSDVGPTSQVTSLVPALAMLSLVVLAFGLPVVLRRYTVSYNRIRGNGMEKCKQRRDGHAIRTCIAIISLVTGLLLSLLVFQALVDVGQLGILNGSVLVLLQVVAAVAVGVGFCCSVRAAYSLWMDWRDVSRWLGEDDIVSESVMIEESLPMIVSSWLERQHRA